MLKLSLAFAILIGTSVAHSQEHPVVQQHPIVQLQGSARVLIVFSPDANSASYKRQLQLIERHSYELTERNTVVVPASLASTPDDHITAENLPLVTSTEQAYARSRFHVQPGDFLVVLLNQDGTEKIRSATPVDIHSLTASLDAPRP